MPVYSQADQGVWSYPGFCGNGGDCLCRVAVAITGSGPCCVDSHSCRHGLLFCRFAYGCRKLDCGKLAKIRPCQIALNLYNGGSGCRGRIAISAAALRYPRLPSVCHYGHGVCPVSGTDFTVGPLQAQSARRSHFRFSENLGHLPPCLCRRAGDRHDQFRLSPDRSALWARSGSGCYRYRHFHECRDCRADWD